MMTKLRQFARLDAFAKRAFVSAALRLAAVRVFVRAIGTPRTVRWLERKRAVRSDAVAALAVAHAVRRAANHLPWRTSCLDRALALFWLLSARGLAATLRIGVRKNEDATLAAHAWVEHQSVALLDDEAEHFAALDRPILDSVG